MEKERNFSLCDSRLYTVLSVYHLQLSHIPHWEGTHCLESTARLLNVVPHAPDELALA